MVVCWVRRTLAASAGRCESGSLFRKSGLGSMRPESLSWFPLDSGLSYGGDSSREHDVIASGARLRHHRVLHRLLLSSRRVGCGLSRCLVDSPASLVL